MATIKCPDCGKEISELAPACINCGRPMKNLKETEKQAGSAVVDLGVYAILTLGAAMFWVLMWVFFSLDATSVSVDPQKSVKATISSISLDGTGETLTCKFGNVWAIAACGYCGRLAETPFGNGNRPEA